jgi:hypothetical protein
VRVGVSGAVGVGVGVGVAVAVAVAVALAVATVAVATVALAVAAVSVAIALQCVAIVRAAQQAELKERGSQRGGVTGLLMVELSSCVELYTRCAYFVN